MAKFFCGRCNRFADTKIITIHTVNEALPSTTSFTGFMVIRKIVCGPCLRPEEAIETDGEQKPVPSKVLLVDFKTRKLIRSITFLNGEQKEFKSYE